MIWWYIAVFTVSFILASALMPKPKTEQAKKQDLGDVGFPRIDEGVPASLVYGKKRMNGPWITYAGGFRAEDITTKVKSGMFSSKRVTVGFEYFFTLDCTIALYCDVDIRLTKIYFGEDLAWEGSQSAEGTFVIDEPDLFGGLKEGGGVSGTVAWFNGNFTQGVDTEIESIEGVDNVPYQRGFAHAVFRDFNFGESVGLKKISFEVESIPNALGFGAVGSEGDANPIEIAYHLLTSPWGGAGLKVSNIDLVSFGIAAQTLDDEEHGMSLAIQRGNRVQEILEEIARQTDGIFYEDVSTKQIKFSLIRFDYVVGDLDIFDEGNIVKILDYNIALWDETFNQVRVIFPSREENYKDKSALSQDGANIETQGKVKTTELNMQGVSNSTLANKISARELNFVSTPRRKWKIEVNRAASKFEPGRVFKFSWEDYGLDEVVVRVATASHGTLGNNTVVLDIIEEKFATSDNIFSDSLITSAPVFVSDPSPVVVEKQLELPHWIGLKGQVAGIIDNVTSSNRMYLATRSSFSDSSYDVVVSDDGGSNYVLDVENGSFVNTARVDTQYEITTGQYDTGIGITINSLDDLESLSNATDAEIRTGGRNMILIDDEIIIYEDFTDDGGGDYTLNNVWRGMLDTIQAVHTSNTIIYFLGDIGVDSIGSNDYADAVTLKYRYLVKNGFAILPFEDAGDEDATAGERSLLPLVPSQMKLNGSLVPANVSLAGASFALTWNRRNRDNIELTRPDIDDDSLESGTVVNVKYRIQPAGFTTANVGNVNNFEIPFAGTGTADVQVLTDNGGNLSSEFLSFSFEIIA